MYISVGRKEVVHNDEVDFAAVGQFHTVQAVEARDEGMRVFENMLVVVLEDLAKELVFRVRDGLDDEAVVAGKVEEAA